MIYYKNPNRFVDNEYHLVSMGQMAEYAKRDNYEREVVYFHFAEVVQLDKIENGNFYFSLKEIH